VILAAPGEPCHGFHSLRTVAVINVIQRCHSINRFRFTYQLQVLAIANQILDQQGRQVATHPL
jgi:hypothetical protein